MSKIISTYLWGALGGAVLLLVGCAGAGAPERGHDGAAALDSHFTLGPVIFMDDFRQGDGLWTSELERGGSVMANAGKFEINVPAGCTVWFKPELSGPVLIEYDATEIAAGGVNDRVSDLNCFWMAQDTRSSGIIWGTARSGKFEDYNQLLCYYVGQGGNTNSTTRFRRYIGSVDTRPLLPENDLRDPADLLTPNARQHISLVACGSLIQYYRDGRRIFELNDPAPYTRGWFAIRTTQSHLVVENFTVRRLLPKDGN